MKKRKKFKLANKIEINTISTLATPDSLPTAPVKTQLRQIKPEPEDDSGENIRSFRDLWVLFLSNIPMIFIVSAVSFAVYWRVVRGEFVNIDDLAGIVQNPIVKDLALAWNSGNAYFLYTAILHHLFGLNSTAFHVASICLHIITSMLVFIVSYMLFGKRIAIIATSLFIVNPTGSEAINWLSASGYIHQAIIILSQLILFILYRRSKNIYYAAAAAIIFSIDIFWYKTPWALISPLVIGTVDLLLLRTKITKNFWLIYLVYIVISFSFVSFTMTKLFENRAYTLETQHYLNLKNATPYLNRIPYSVYMIFRQYLFPERLTIYHEGLTIGNAEYTFMVISTVLYVALVIILLLTKKFRDYATLLILILVCTAPSFSPIAIAWLVAERYLYLGVTFFTILLAKIFIDLENKTKLVKLTNVLTVLFFVIYFVRTEIRAGDFQNSKNLWLATMVKSPLSYRVYNNLGDVYANEGNYPLAIENFHKSLQLKPDYADAVHNLGFTYMQMGEFDKAKDVLLKSFEMNPRLYQSLFKLGYIELQQNNLPQAKEYFYRTLQVNPENVEAKQILQAIDKYEKDGTPFQLKTN